MPLPAQLDRAITTGALLASLALLVPVVAEEIGRAHHAATPPTIWIPGCVLAVSSSSTW